MSATTITLYPVHATPETIELRPLAEADAAAGTTIYLFQRNEAPTDTTILMQAPSIAPANTEQLNEIEQAETVTLVTLTATQNFQELLVESAESITLTRAVGHIVSALWAQTVSLLRSAGKIISLASAETVTLRRAIGTTISVLQAKAVTLSRRLPSLIEVDQAQTVTLSNRIDKLLSIEGDPYWAYVVFLSGFEGANGASLLYNERTGELGSPSNVYSADAAVKFGSTSLAVPYGAGTVWLNFNTSPNWNLSPYEDSSFTIEAWIRLDGGGGGYHTIASCNQGTEALWAFHIVNDQLAFTYWPDGTYSGSTTYLNSGSLTWTGDWYFVSFSKQGYLVYMHRDGDLVYSSLPPAIALPNPTTAHLVIGAYYDIGGFELVGNIDELRITKGVGRYGPDDYSVPDEAFLRQGGTPLVATLEKAVGKNIEVQQEQEETLDAATTTDRVISFVQEQLVSLDAVLAAIDYAQELIASAGQQIALALDIGKTIYVLPHCWILEHGYWDDNGHWVDAELWQDAPWILWSGYWDDNGIWIDGDTWQPLACPSMVMTLTKDTAPAAFEVQSPEDVSLIRSASITINAAITILIDFATDTFNGTIEVIMEVAQEQAVSLSKHLGNLSSIVQEQAVSLVRSTENRIAITTGQVASITRAIASAIVIGSGQAVTLARTLSSNLTLLVSIGSTVTLARLVGKPITIQAAQLLTVIRASNRTITLGTGEQVTLGRRMPYRLNTAQIGQTVTLARLKKHLRTLTVAIGQTFVIRRSIAHKRLYARAQRVTLQKLIRKINLFAQVGQLVTLTRKYFKVFAPTLAQLVTVARKMAHLVTIATTVAASVLKTVNRTIAILQGQVIRFGKVIEKPLATTLGQIILMGRLSVQIITVDIPQSLTLLPDYIRSLRRRAHLKWQGLPTRKLDAEPPSPVLEAAPDTSIPLKAVSQIIDEDKDIEVQADTNIDQHLKAE